MKLGDFILLAIFAGLPLWLAVRAWRRYFTLGTAPIGDLFQLRVGLALISAATCMWIATFGIMVLEDFNGVARSIGQNLSPVTVGLVNFLLCIGGLGCSGFGWTAARGTLPLRKAIGVSSACLMVLWLFVLGNPH